MAGVFNHNKVCSTLASELCQGRVTRLSFGAIICDSAISVKLQGVSGLTSITQGDSVKSESIALLAYHNGHTLRALSLKLIGKAEWLVLIRSDDSAPMIYGNLTSLSLARNYSEDASAWPAVKDVVPFPVLSMLSISGNYLYGSNVLLRASDWAFESSGVPFSTLEQDLLGKLGVRERSGVMWVKSAHVSHELDEHAVIKQRFHRILNMAATQETESSTASMHIHAAITPSTAILQHLNLSYLGFDTIAIFGIISAFPNLASLACNICGPAKRIGLIPKSERPSALRTKYHPLSGSFRKLQVTNATKDLIAMVAIIAMQLAVVCPSFAHTYIKPELRKAFNGLLRMAHLSRMLMRCAAFSKHTAV
ncbi:hypothetical protein GGF44_002966 [Coemansia sp. RSA 1694]|nr:hypothetical protein GGF44_002966 [Coemansia sp. RSA 1694]